MSLVISKYYIHSGLIIWCHTDTPYRQDPNSGEDKGGLLGPKKDPIGRLNPKYRYKKNFNNEKLLVSRWRGV